MAHVAQVWYWKSEFARDLLMGYDWCLTAGKLPYPSDLGKTHVHLMNVSSDDPDDIFCQMQGEVWSPKGKARRLILAKGLGHTSMSVGDVIVLADGEAWMVDLVGFRKL
jgi:hypothetical protein